VATSSYGLVHLEWATDDDGERAAGTREEMQSFADQLNKEWPNEGWVVALSTDGELPKVLIAQCEWHDCSAEASVARTDIGGTTFNLCQEHEADGAKRDYWRAQ